MKDTAPALAMPPSAWMQIILLSAIWGGSFLFGRIAAQEVPALGIAFARVSIAAALLWAFFLVSRREIPVLTRELVIALLVMGLVNNAIPFSGLKSYTVTPSLVAAQWLLGKKVSINNPFCSSSVKE
jgi:drug/metabolite transporter (DMT)-like permease